MGGSAQPFLYEANRNANDARFPTAEFNPKAVTRASWEVKPKKKKKKNGPLISVNRHPDMMEAPKGRPHYRMMSHTAKSWIKAMRVVQLVLRVLELVAAIGLLTLMILINNVDALAGWILRITLGVNILHCTYGIFHLARPAGGRTPGTSASYHIFAGFSDLAVLLLYAYGILTIRNSGTTWSTFLDNKDLAVFFVPAVYYALIGAGGLHVVSLAISLWLGLMFRRITQLPPDMNPLEDHLTTRGLAHKRNKSSMSTLAESEKRLSTPLEQHRRSGVPYQDLSRPPSVPFMHTRHGSDGSISGSPRDSRVNLPSRRYQVDPGASSPRDSVASAEIKRMSCPPLPKPPTHGRGAYFDLGERETSSSSRPSSGTVPSYKAVPVTPTGETPQPRAAKFTEAWYTSESLVERTQQRNRAVNQMVMNATGRRSAYAAVDQNTQDTPEDDSDEEHGDASRYENNYSGFRVDEVSLANGKDREITTLGKTRRSTIHQDDDMDDETDLGASRSTHPNPLGSHPTPPLPPSPASGGRSSPRRPRTPFNHASPLSEVNLNDRRVSGSTAVGQDIADVSKLSGDAWQPRNRDSSIQPETGFYSKPYGQLQAGTPPLMQTVGTSRQVSSGNDYDMGTGAGYRRAVSGKLAEEGRAGGQHRNSRFGA